MKECAAFLTYSNRMLHAASGVLWRRFLKEPLSTAFIVQRNISLTTVSLTKCPPKRRRTIETIRRKRYNLRKFFPLTRSWHNIIPCDTCGGYHRKWLLCPTCYDQTRYETEMVRKDLRERNEELSEESVLKYRNDNEHLDLSDGGARRVINIEHRDRPAGWFSESLWKRP
ncbi:unnamed protein product [Clavelina lepadiformis]|uniref:Mitochondrial ribosomal protein L32 n=1 Tax=Clavelina lepadiformis TaxID=159417 RepID=A0ABP0F4H2_CLALP